MRSVHYMRNGLMLVMTMGWAAGPSNAESVCFHISTLLPCSANPPQQSECDWGNGWTKDGPWAEYYVVQKTPLSQGSGSYVTTRKCRRFYIMSKPGEIDQYCYGGSYGVNYSFVNGPCIAGGSLP